MPANAPGAMLDQSTPADNRASRTPVTTLTTTLAVDTSGNVTNAGWANLQNGDIVKLTAKSGDTGNGFVVGNEYHVIKTGATTGFLSLTLAGSPVVAVTSGLTSGTLTYGRAVASQGNARPNIVAMGSTAGGGFASPQD